MEAITASKAVLLESADGKGGRWGKISTGRVSHDRAEDLFSTDSASENTSEQNALSGVKSTVNPVSTRAHAEIAYAIRTPNTEEAPMNKMTQLKQWAHAHEDIFIDLVRAYLGVGLFIKGIFLMTHRQDLVRLIESSGDLFIAPATVAHYVIPAHVFGGLLLAIGLLTRVAALVQLPVLMGAVFWVYLPKMMLPEPRQNLEFSALVLFLLILIALFGPGRWSVDHLLSRKEQPDLQPQTAM